MAARYSLVAGVSRFQTIKAGPHVSDLVSNETSIGNSDGDFSLSLVTLLGLELQENVAHHIGRLLQLLSCSVPRRAAER